MQRVFCTLHRDPSEVLGWDEGTPNKDAPQIGDGWVSALKVPVRYSPVLKCVGGSGGRMGCEFPH